MQKVGLLGWPLRHSVSPAMHNAAFKALGLDWRYDALPVRPEALEERLPQLLDEGYRGFNVTVPHKHAVLSVGLPVTVDEAVATMGATNTLTVKDDGSLLATNTDWQGFMDDLREHNAAVEGKCCLILGTGGSAQAVAYALRKMRAGRITFVSRKPGCLRWRTVRYDQLGQATARADLVINCTPVGMSPNVDQTPWPEEVAFPPDAVLYDLVYNPPVTRLMQQARDVGAKTIGGLGMLIRQGMLSFEQWTDVEPSYTVMEKAALLALSE
jgi:shikimate dehydrogenase